MSKASTQRVSRALTTARERGIVPWEWIVDEHREIEQPATWNNPENYLRTVARSYKRDLWTFQSKRLLVVSEKGTVGGVLRPVLEEYGVPFLVAHGFNSATLIMDIATMSVADDRPLTILYVGDFDPSGMFMSESDIPTRLHNYGGEADVLRVALTEDHLGDLPSFPAKRKDPRYRWYTDHYGPRFWELDSLDPNILRNTVKQAIDDHIDPDAWSRAADVNKVEIASIRAFLSTHPVFCNQFQNTETGGAA